MRQLTVMKRPSAYREAREAVLDKAFLIVRPDDLPQLLKPLRAAKPGRCVLSGHKIQIGDYCFAAYDNPVRLTPTGRDRVLVDEVAHKITAYLPFGCVSLRVPQISQFANLREIEGLERARRKQLEIAGTKLLQAGKMNGGKS